MSEATGLSPDLEDLIEVGSDETDKGSSRKSLVLASLLVLLLCVIVTAVDVWVERSPEERDFITRNIECLQCHTELIPDLARSAVHDPFLKEDCTTCHTAHGREVTERVTGGGWKRWEQVRTAIEWLPLKLACEAFETPGAVTDGDDGGEVVSQTTRREKGDESLLTAPMTELCWICHGDLAREKVGDPHQHAPFERGFCTDCHDPHASDHRVLLKRDERDLCPSCHPMFDELARNQLHPPYQGRFCTNCHDPHASEWGGVLVTNQKDLCFTCHPSVAPLSLKAVQHNPFEYDNCTGCHEPHASDALPLLIAEQPDVCYDCHPGIEYDFLKPSHHPVGTVQLNCADCHNPHAADYAALLTARDNEMCFQCHERQIGQAYAIGDGYADSAHDVLVCVECHTPHGSDYAPILRRSNPDICLQCHPGYADPGADHPARPASYHDEVADAGLTCSSTCHDPHGTPYHRMLQVPYGVDGVGTDFLCLLCHYGVGVEF